MSAVLRTASPDLLLDWDRVLNGEMMDDVSGLTWAITRAIVADTGSMLGGTSGAFTGSEAITINNVLWGGDWTAVTFCRCDQRTAWQKLWEFAIGNTYSDYISVSQLQSGYFGFGPYSIGAHLTPPNDTEARAFAMAYYWPATAHMLTWRKRGATLDFLMGSQTVGSCACGESSNKLRRIMLGNEYTFGSTTGWRGGIGGFGLWRRALSAEEIRFIWHDVRPSAANVPVSARSISGSGASEPFAGGGVISVAGLRANGMAGPGSLDGTVKIQITPTTKVPARRRVRVLDTETGQLLYETWSDERTGYWRVNGLALGRWFTVLSHDHLRDYNAATADWRLAEIMS